MGGKTSTSTQSVQVPQSVLNNYNQAYGTAQSAASQPFQAYGGQFVAPPTDTQKAGIANVNAAAGAAQPYYGAATGELMGSQGAAMPYYSQATGNVGAAQNVGNALAASSLGSLAQGQYNANPLQYQAAGQLSGAYDQAQSANQDAYNQYMGSQAAAQPLNYQALNTLGGAQGAGAALTAQGLNTLGQAGAAASPYNQQAAAAYQQAATAPQQFNQLAANQYFAGLGAANPLNQEAQALGEQSAQSINPTALNQSAIDQYMTPYMSSVVGSEQALLNQQNQQAMSGQLGNAIQAGAFGGDRSGIAAANLAQQQQIANANIYSNLLNQGYSQALSAAQQQQGVGLGAAQANRAAQAAAGQQLGSLAQQQYAQQTGTGQQLANLGQQVYSQPLGLGAAQAQLGQQIFGQGNTLAQQQLAAGQQLFGQGATTAQQQAALAQQLFGQGQTTGQNVAALGQQGFGQNITSAQAQAALAQQLYGQGATTSQQQAALGQQQYAQGIGAAQQLQGIGQGLYGMGSGTSASLANIGQGAQNAAIQGGQAQLAAGTIEQQTQQALDQALYNQFLQQQAYPFQTSQFLTNAALGLGTAQGSTTTTTQPGGFFSDKRLKENIREIGKDFSGKKLYRFNYKGDNKTHVGYIAQEIEKSAPEAVGESHGYKTVDYGKASEEAADRGHYYSGGVVPQSMGGHVAEEHGGEGYALGGSPSGIDATDFAAILAAQQQMFGPYAQSGRGLSGMPGAGSVVPGANIPVSKIATAPELHQNRTALENIKQATDAATGLNKAYQTFKQPVQNAVQNAAQSVRKMFATPDQSKSTSDALSQTVPQKTSSPSSAANIEPKNSYDDFDSSNDLSLAKGGFIKTHRIGLAGGGIPYESDETGPRFGIPEESGSHKLSALQFARGGLAGYASGGASDLPYASGEGQTSLDIPDENKNENKLQTAPGLAPQPTGLQNTAALVSTAAGVADLAKIFMALPLAAGGVAGRRRRADGGTDDDGNDYIVSPSDSDGGGSDYPISNQFRKDNDDQEQVGDYPLSGQKNPAAQEALRKSDILQKQLMDQVQKTGLAKVLANKPTLPTGLNVPDLSNVPVRLPADQSSDNFPEAKIDTSSQAAAAAPAPVQASNSGQPTIAPTNQSALDTSKANPQKQNIVDRALGLLKDKQGNYDQQKVVPLLSFLAAMGTAPTRSLGVALASGVGAGAKSYLDTQKTLANLGLTQAQTDTQRAESSEIMSKIPSSAIISDSSGRMLGIRTYDNNNNIVVVPADEYFRNVKSGRQYKLTPSLTAQAPATTSVSGQPLAETGADRQPAQPAAQTSAQTKADQQMAAGPAYKVLPNDWKQDAADAAGNVFRAGSLILAKDPANSPFANDQAMADSARQNKNQRNLLARSLLESKDSGQFAQNVYYPLTQYVQSALQTFGVPSEEIQKLGIDPSNIASKEEIDKISTSLALASQAAQGSKAFQEFKSILATVPTAGNSRQGQIDLMSNILTQNQRSIDLNNAEKLWLKEVQNNGADQASALQSGYGFEGKFSSKQDSAYNTERDVLKRMMARQINVPDDKGVNHPVNLVTYLIDHNGQINDKLKSVIQKNFAPKGYDINEILRYFQGG